MTKTFLDRMRTMIASGKTDEVAGELHAPEIPLHADAEGGPLHGLKTFMENLENDQISLNHHTGSVPHILDGHGQQGYLAGQLLIATPLIDTGTFQKSVVFVFAHNAEGAMGVIINQPLELVQFSSLVEGLDLTPDQMQSNMPVYYGGPVDRHRGFVLHSSDYVREHTLIRHGEVAITASNAILRDIIAGKGPKQAYLSVGFAGWTAGQLEQEIEQNSWISVPATAELVFGTENELKWATASKSLGVDMNFFSTTIGHA